MPICVIGMHRTGTSLVTRLLNLCGLQLGSDEKLMCPNDANPRGYFENWNFVEINDAILRSLGGSWDNPPDLKEGWEYDPSLSSISEQAKLNLGAFSNFFAWGWKDPRTTVLIPFWKRLIPDLRFVICVRSPLEVAKSLARRDGFTIEKGVYLWNRYTRAAIRHTEGSPRIFTFYEDYFKDAVKEIDRLVKFCKLQKPVDDSILKAVISDELKHHSSETLELLNENKIAAEYKIFYIGLRALLFDDFITSKTDRLRYLQTSENINRFFQLIEDFHNVVKMAQLETVVMEKEYVLSHAQTLLIEKEKQVSQFQSAVLQKEKQAGQLQTVIVQKELQCIRLEAALQNQQELLKKQEEVVAQIQVEVQTQQQELNRIHSSLGWKCVISYCKVINRIFPNQSKRRKLYDLILYRLKL